MRNIIAVDVQDLLRRVIDPDGHRLATSYEIQDNDGRWLNATPQEYRNLLRHFRQEQRTS